MVKGNRIPFFSDFAIRYNTDVPATPPTSANKMRRSGAIFSNPVGGGGGVGLMTRITLKYLKFGIKIVCLGSVLFVVCVAELLKAVAKLIDSFGCGAYNHSEETILKEAL